MRLPLQERLRLLRPWISDRLIGPEAWERLTSVAQQLGPTWSWGCLEARMDGQDPEVDLLVCATRLDGDQEAMRQAPRGPLLEPIRNHLDAWLDEENPFSQNPMLWVEFDLPPGQPDRAPFTHLRLQPHHPTGALLPAPSWAEMEPQIREWAGRVLGEVPASRLELLRHCVAALPEDGRVMHLNIASSRGSRDWRFDVNLPIPEIGPYLKRIGWPGEVSRLDPWYPIFGNGCQRFSVQVDLGETVRPNLAWEHFRMAGDGPLWRGFLGAMVERGLCDAPRAQDLLAWLGQDLVRSPLTPWPVEVIRQLDVKLVMRPEGMYAKAYLTWCLAQRVFLGDVQEGARAGTRPATQAAG